MMFKQIFQLVLGSIAFLSAQNSFAQKIAVPGDSVKKQSSNISSSEHPSFITLGIAGGFYFGLSDLANKYPYFTTIPLSVEYQHKQQYILSLDYNIFLGSQVNTYGIFDNIMNANGDIIDINGHPALIKAYMRGYSIRAHWGKNIILKKINKAASWSLQAGCGIGYTQNHIKYQFDQGRLPQLEGDYASGYDRMAAGWQFAERLRLQYLNNQVFSFFVGLDYTQGVSQNKRPWNFNDNIALPKSIFEQSIGINAGLIIPIRLDVKHNESEYYY